MAARPLSGFALAAVLAVLAAGSGCRRVEPVASTPTPGAGLRLEEVARAEAACGMPYDVAVAGRRAYLANGAGGLIIVDLAGRTPKVLGRCVTGAVGHHTIGRAWIHEYRGEATAVSVAGRFAFLLTQSKGYDVGRSKVLRIDVSDPANPAFAGEYVLTGRAVDLAAIDEARVCVTRRPGGVFPPNTEGVLTVLDFGEAGRARAIGHLRRTPKVAAAGSFGPLVVGGATAFVGGSRGTGDGTEGRLHVVSLADPMSPSLVTTLPMKAAAVFDLSYDPRHRTLFVAEGVAAISVLDVSDPSAPKPLATVDPGLGRAVAVTVGDRSAYVGAYAGVAAVSLEPPFPVTHRTGLLRDFEPRRMAACRRGVVVADRPMKLTSQGPRGRLFPDPRSGLAVYGPSTKGKLAEAGRLRTVGERPTVRLSGSRLRLDLGPGGTVDFDASNPRALRRHAEAPPARLPRDDGETVLHADGKTLCVGVNAFGLRFYDASNPNGLALLGEAKLSESGRMTPRALVLRDGVGYLAAGRDGLWTLDVTDPKQPRPLDRFYDAAIRRMAVADVKVVGPTAYLADLDNGLYVVDVADPRQPKLLSRVHTANAHAVDVAGSLAVVADGVYGATAIDVSNPRQPRVVGRHHAPGIRFTDVALRPPEQGQRAPGIVYLADAGWVRAFRLRPAPAPAWQPPELVAHLKLPMGIPDRVRVSADGTTAFMVNDEGWNLIAIDIADPTKPRMRSVSATSGFAHGLALRGHLAFACNNSDACTIFDMTHPDKPVLVSAVMPFNRCAQAEVVGDALFLHTADGLVCVDITDVRKPQVKGTHKGLWREYVACERGGRRTILGAGPDGWHVVDATDLAKPRQVALLPGRFACTAVQGDLAYVGTGKELAVIRWAEKEPQIVGRVATPEAVGRVAVRGRSAYFAGRVLGVVDVADPKQPKLLAQVKAAFNEGTYGGATGQFSDVRPFTRDGRDYLAAVDHYWGLRLYDASDKARLKEIGDFATSGGDFTGIQADGSRVYVGNNWGGVYIVDAREPAKPRLIGSTRRITRPNKGSVGHLAAGERLYFQGNTDRTLRIADVAKPASPRLLGEFPLPKEGQVGDNRRFGSTFPQLRSQRLYTPGFARVFDVSDPRTPRLIGQCKEVGFQNDSCALAELGGRLHLVIASQEGLKVVDVGDPRAPRLVGVAPGDHQGGYYFGRGLCVAGSVAYVCDRHQVNLVDLSDPAQPRRLSSIEVSGFTCDVKVAGGLAYIVGYYGGLHIADVRDPRQPMLIDHFQQGVYWDAAAWDNIACYQCVDVTPGYIYLTEYYSGLHILRVGPR